ncbi:MAG: opacity protein-like surface antigen [Phenylobacterium sp.]|jgi:opacity protein-like surface antigen
MNKVLATTLAATLVSAFTSTAALADDSYPKNPILRPITLADGDFELVGAIGHVSKIDGEDKGYIVPAIRYGITDNLTVGLNGVSYRFLAKDDLQLAANVGLRGHFDSKAFGDSTGYGFSVGGKKVLSDNLALTFGVGYVHWDEDVLKDRSEIDYSVGLMFNVAEDWTIGASYKLRDLEDFSQSTANVIGLNVNYAVSNRLDVGLFTAGSNFDDRVGGKVVHNSFDTTTGAFVAWRW